MAIAAGGYYPQVRIWGPYNYDEINTCKLVELHLQFYGFHVDMLKQYHYGSTVGYVILYVETNDVNY
jgi:hypothetical protein